MDDDSVGGRCYGRGPTVGSTQQLSADGASEASAQAHDRGRWARIGIDDTDDTGFVAMIERLIVDGDVGKTVEGIVGYASTALATPHVGITLQHDHGRRLESLGPTTDVVSRADDSQHELHEGPCVDAATDAGSVRSGDVTRDPRWPRWGPRAGELGLYSIVSAELKVGGRNVGGLNVYGERLDQFDLEDAAIASELAQHAVVALVAAKRLADLETALGTRTLIGPAQGILMQRHQIDASAAFSMLRRYSQDHNVKLRWVAGEVVRTTHLPGPPAPPER